MTELINTDSEAQFTAVDMATQAANAFRDGYRQALQDIASNLLQPLAEERLNKHASS